MHEELDRGIAAGSDLGCQHVQEGLVGDRRALHPTWTHSRLVQRPLSCITRAELVRCGPAVSVDPPADVLVPMNDDDLREAVRAELCGYWAWASRRPWMWLDPGIADLALSGMARARYTLRTGQLLTKTEAIEQVHGPAWLIDQLRARRRGEPMSSPRVRTGWIAWRDARDTLGWASRSAPRCGG